MIKEKIEKSYSKGLISKSTLRIDDKVCSTTYQLYDKKTTNKNIGHISFTNNFCNNFCKDFFINLEKEKYHLIPDEGGILIIGSELYQKYDFVIENIVGKAYFKDLLDAFDEAGIKITDYTYYTKKYHIDRTAIDLSKAFRPHNYKDNTTKYLFEREEFYKLIDEQVVPDKNDYFELKLYVKATSISDKIDINEIRKIPIFKAKAEELIADNYFDFNTTLLEITINCYDEDNDIRFELINPKTNCAFGYSFIRNKETGKFIQMQRGYKIFVQDQKLEHDSFYCIRTGMYSMSNLDDEVTFEKFTSIKHFVSKEYINNDGVNTLTDRYQYFYDSNGNLNFKYHSQDTFKLNPLATKRFELFVEITTQYYVYNDQGVSTFTELRTFDILGNKLFESELSDQKIYPEYQYNIRKITNKPIDVTETEFITTTISSPSIAYDEIKHKSGCNNSKIAETIEIVGEKDGKIQFANLITNGSIAAVIYNNYDSSDNCLSSETVHLMQDRLTVDDYKLNDIILHH